MMPVESEEKPQQRSWARKQNIKKPVSLKNVFEPEPKLEKITFPHSRWDGLRFVPADPMPQPMINTQVMPLKDAMLAWKIKHRLLSSYQWPNLSCPSVSEQRTW